VNNAAITNLAYQRNGPGPLPGGKFTGMVIDLPALGRVRLTHVLSVRTETEVYLTDHPGVVAKLFDVSCGKADEISFGPYMEFAGEVANYGEILGIDSLRPYIPAYYGGNIDYTKKQAYIAIEYVDGQDLKSWCEEGARDGHPTEWVAELREAVYEALAIMRLFHKHGIILTDFKPDNVLRLRNRGIKFVDLGALFTPRHFREKDKFVYSATPDHAEVAIDASKMQTGVPPAVTSDIFSAGVALFEMATGGCRLVIDEQTADEILSCPAIFRFQDSQIRDIWRSYPHLREALPLLETQLKERQILFADLWHLFKGYLAHKVPDWESLAQEQQDSVILATGTTFILDQLPPRLQWLAGPIAQATVLRSIRLKTVEALMALISSPIAGGVLDDVREANCFIQYLRDLELPVGFVERLNTWEVRSDQATGHWAISAPAACGHLGDPAQVAFLRLARGDPYGHRYYDVVGDLEADDCEDTKLVLWHLRNDPCAWLS